MRLHFLVSSLALLVEKESEATLRLSIHLHYLHQLHHHSLHQLQLHHQSLHQVHPHHHQLHQPHRHSWWRATNFDYLRVHGSWLTNDQIDIVQLWLTLRIYMDMAESDQIDVVPGWKSCSVFWQKNGKRGWSWRRRVSIKLILHIK